MADSKPSDVLEGLALSDIAIDESGRVTIANPQLAERVATAAAAAAKPQSPTNGSCPTNVVPGCGPTNNRKGCGPTNTGKGCGVLTKPTNADRQTQ